MFGQIFWTVVTRGLLISASFLSSVVTARMLGPEGRGVFFYWTTLAAFAIQLGNVGLHASNTYYLAKRQAPFSVLAVNSLWVSLIVGSVVGGILTSILWLSGRPLHDEWMLLLPTLLSIPAGLYFLLGTNLFVALQRFGEYNGFELVNRYAGLMIVFVAAWFYKTPESLVAAIALISAFVCVILYQRLRRLGGKGLPSLTIFCRGLGYGLRAYIVAALALLVLRLNALILEHFVPASSLGVWSIAAQLLDVVVIVPATFALVLFPKLAESDNPYRLMRSQLRVVTVVLATICLVTILLGHNVIVLAYGEQFSAAYEMLLWGLPGALALGLIAILSQHLAAAGIPMMLLAIWCAGLGIEFALAIVLVPAHGGVGAMAALSTAYLSVLAMIWALIIRIEGARNQTAPSHAR